MPRGVDALAPYPLRNFTFGVRGEVEDVKLVEEETRVVGRWKRYGPLLRCDRVPWLLRDLAKPQRMTRQREASLIELFANCPPTWIERFTRDYGPLSKPFSPGEPFDFWCDEWKQTQINFRRDWESRMLQGRKKLRHSPHYKDIPVEEGERFVFGSLGLQYEVATVERLVLLELYSQPPGRLRKCQRPACENPYFLSNRPLRAYCSGPCASDAQREVKRKWWREKGAQQRREKARTAKKQKTRK